MYRFRYDDGTYKARSELEDIMSKVKAACTLLSLLRLRPQSKKPDSSNSHLNVFLDKILEWDTSGRVTLSNRMSAASG